MMNFRLKLFSKYVIHLFRYGVKRVVASMVDPDPRVAGMGLAFLRRQGIQTDVGVLQTHSKALNQQYIFRVLNKRPYTVVCSGMLWTRLLDFVHGKFAHTKDGQMTEMIDSIRGVLSGIDMVQLSVEQFLELFGSEKRRPQAYQILSSIFQDHISVFITDVLPNSNMDLGVNLSSSFNLYDRSPEPEDFQSLDCGQADKFLKVRSLSMQ